MAEKCSDIEGLVNVGMDAAAGGTKGKRGEDAAKTKEDPKSKHKTKEGCTKDNPNTNTANKPGWDIYQEGWKNLPTKDREATENIYE